MCRFGRRISAYIQFASIVFFVVVVWPTTEKKSLWVVGTKAQVLIHQCKDGVQRWRYAAEYAQMLGLREFNSVVIEVNLWAKICASQLLNNRSKYINI